MQVPAHEGGEQFTSEEVAGLFDDDKAVQQLIMERLAALQVERKQRREAQERLEDIVDMSAAHRRILGPEGGEVNHSNIEGWFSGLADAAYGTLQNLHKDVQAGRELSEFEQLARDTAVMVYFRHEQVHNTRLEMEDWQLFADLGVTESWLVEQYKAGLRRMYVADDNPKRDENEHLIGAVTTMADVERFVGVDGTFDEVIVWPWLDKLTATLKEQGVELPVLGDDGLYDEERNEQNREWWE